MLRVQDIMSTDVVTVHEGDTAQQAARIMNQYQVSSLIVTEHNLPIGIITETDLTRKLVANAKDATQTQVHELLTSPIYYTDPDADIIEVAHSMRLNRIKKTPVIKGDRLLGIVTQTDIVRHIFESIKQLESEYRRGSLSDAEYAKKSNELFKHVRGTLSDASKEWHMVCNDCNHQFLDEEQEGNLRTTNCPRCGSTNIRYDQNPDV